VGIEAASALGGLLGRMLGVIMTSKNRIARHNLKASFPDMADSEVEKIIRDMWDNLGRYAGELPHLHDLDVYGDDQVEITADIDLDDPEVNRLPAIYFNAHFGNFDVSTLLAIQRGFELTLVYREASNPWSEAIIQYWREKRGGIWVPKGREGARALLKAIRKKGAIAILADQKFNEGIPVPFFGRDAMTAPALAELAIKYDVPLLPVRVLRRPRAHFHVHVFRPIEIPDSGDRAADVRAILLEINQTFEGWIRENPEHWLWIHRRWPD
ncbi:MAG: lysophospholipid acyltransferase family protein, partial [Rhodospirillaceae bacterium]|nr:lysophospholipid acyltransferase family protein [Rhodospirillaceae bacterium]